MTYTAATKLHVGDEVKVKDSGDVITVLWIENFKGRKEVFVHGEDGNTYHHREIS